MQVLSVSLLSDIEERDTKRALYATADPSITIKQEKTNISIFLEFKAISFREIDPFSQFALLGSRSPYTNLSLYRNVFYKLNSYNKTQPKPKQN